MSFEEPDVSVAGDSVEQSGIVVQESVAERKEDLKLEWGKGLDDESMHSGEEEDDALAELNKDIPDGERKWRLPTSKELELKFAEAAADLPKGMYRCDDGDGTVGVLNGKTEKDLLKVLVPERRRIEQADPRFYYVRFVR